MGWFKRNLFFAIGCIVALGLLGAAGFYVYKSWQRNNAAYDHLNELYNSKKNNTVSYNGKSVSPGDGKVDNIALAKEQAAQLRQWLNQTTNYFRPITPIPNPAKEKLNDQSFNGALHSNLTQLTKEAAAVNVALPPGFSFSFTAEQDLVKFAAGSLEPLSVQLGEVKTISEVLFGANVNALDGIQRLRVSADDTAGPPTDYLDDQPVTVDQAVVTPYQVTFRGFSPEIARVLGGFAASSHGFIVKAMSVQPAGPSGATAQTGANGAYPPPAMLATGNAQLDYYRAVTGGGAAPAAPAAVPGRGGSQPVLNEQLLSITLKLEVLKLAPRN